MSNIPEDLSYTAEHEWVSAPSADGVVRVGITDFAQDALGDVVYAQLPEAGTKVTANDVVGEVESTKSVSDIYAPVSGEVVARSEAAKIRRTSRRETFTLVELGSSHLRRSASVRAPINAGSAVAKRIRQLVSAAA